MDNRDRPEDRAAQERSRGGSWIGRGIWVFVTAVSLVVFLARAWRSVPVATAEYRLRQSREETDLLSSPWFWRILWVFIGAVMLLFFLYEYLWLH